MKQYAAIWGCLLSISLFSLELKGDTYSDSFESMYQTHRKLADCQPDKMLPLWTAFIEKNRSHSRVIEAQYLKSRIYWVARGETHRQYLPYVKKIVEGYQGTPSHVDYLRLLMTYGQAIAPESKRESIFRRIMSLTKKELVYPPHCNIPIPANRALQRGAVWAELQEKTRRLNGIQERTEKADSVANELRRLPNGKALYAFAFDWIRADQNRLRRSADSPAVVMKPLSPSPAPEKKEPPAPRLGLAKFASDFRDSPPLEQKPLLLQASAPTSTAEEGNPIWWFGIGILALGILLLIGSLQQKTPNN